MEYPEKKLHKGYVQAYTTRMLVKQSFLNAGIKLKESLHK